MSVPAAPTNLLSRNVGNGSVELQWTPVAGAVSYNIYISNSAAGPFTKANIAPVVNSAARLPNLVFRTTVYFKVTAVNASGESIQSALAQDATASVATTVLCFKGLKGDQIAAGAIFAAVVGTQLISVQTLAGGTCQ
jgi:hypothetical protein